MVAFAFLLTLAALAAAPSLGAQPPRDSLRNAASPIDSTARTRTDGTIPRSARGASITVIDDEGVIRNAPSLPLALQARVPGLSVTEGGGLVGSSARVWLRGPGSLYLNEPLIIIDGARTHLPLPFYRIPSWLDDIDSESVERVEILSGIAAAAVYGPGASKGVILVTTKRGRAGPARWSAFGESGAVVEVTSFPANFETLGVSTANGSPVASCPLSSQADGTCTPTVRQTFNPLERVSPFRTGWRNSAGLQISGGTPSLTYFAGANHESADGVYETDWARAANARVALAVAPTRSLDVGFIVGHRTKHLRHPWISPVRAGLLGGATDDPITRGYADAPARLERGKRTAESRRTNFQVNALWRRREWLHARALFGLEELSESTREAGPLFEDPSGPVTFFRAVETGTITPRARTFGASVTATYDAAGMRMRSMFGAEHIRENQHGTTFTGYEPDMGSYSVSWVRSRRRSTGLFVQQHASWRDRVFLTGSLRADRPEKLDLDDVISTSLDLSWTVVDSTHRWATPALGSIRLRAAYGRGGAHFIRTDHRDNDQFSYRRMTETAERMVGVEIGADASLLADRAVLAVTAYRAANDQGLAPGFSFGPPMMLNDARFRTTGIEGSMDVRLLRRNLFAWDAGVMFSAQDNETRSLPMSRETLPWGTQWTRNGDGIGEYYNASMTYADSDGDGRISSAEASMGGDSRPIGSPFPDYEAAIRSTIGIGSAVRLSAVLDRRAGQELVNRTHAVRCDVWNCQDRHDVTTPLADQARAVLLRTGGAYNYVEDASYTKLREVRLEVALPHTWAALGGARRAHVTLTGRNLHTWTSYSGLDPEVLGDDHNGFAIVDDFHHPPLRSFSARLDLSW